MKKLAFMAVAAAVASGYAAPRWEKPLALVKGVDYVTPGSSITNVVQSLLSTGNPTFVSAAGSVAADKVNELALKKSGGRMDENSAVDFEDVKVEEEEAPLLASSALKGPAPHPTTPTTRRCYMKMSSDGIETTQYRTGTGSWLGGRELRSYLRPTGVRIGKAPRGVDPRYSNYTAWEWADGVVRVVDVMPETDGRETETPQYEIALPAEGGTFATEESAAAAIRAAISTNNAAFCQAVRDVGGFPLVPPDEGAGFGDVAEYGTLGASVAALVAALAALRKSKADKSVYDADSETMSVDTFVDSVRGA